jgi:HAD superfamily hydrolase (TIGR01549 family)
LLRRSRRNKIKSLQDVIALSQRFDVVSFDLFDTLLARTTLSFEEIQHLAAERAMQHADPTVFDLPETLSFYRHHTSTILRDSISLGSREPTLDAIIDRILASRAGAMSRDERSHIVREIVEFELQLELGSLVVHPDAIPVLTALRQSGKRVIALSDMYFSPDHMKRLLEMKGLLSFFDEVFVSTEIGETKHEGRAFDVVKSRLGVGAERILHVGDNPISDGDNAIAAGWSAAHITGHFLQLEAGRGALSGTAQLIHLASDIMASFLIAVLSRARRSGVRRVYFLSRDATVMVRIWEAVRAANPELAAQFEGIEVRELCVSRSSTHALSMLWTKDFVVEAVGRVAWLARRDVSYREVADYYGIPLPATAGRADRRLPVHALAAAIEKDGDAELRRAVRQRQDLALEYLRQEGAVGDGRVMFGDIGYSGTIAVYLTNYLLREAPDLLAKTHIDMLMAASNSYLGQNQSLARQGATIHPAILFRHEELPAILSDNFAWLECLFRDTTRGQLRTYVREHGRLVPEFDPTRENRDAIRPEFEREAVRKLSRGLDALGYGTPARIGRIRAEAQAAFMRPSPELVAAVGDLTQEADALGDMSHPVVEKVPRSAIPARLRHWKVADYWISGCLVASGQAQLIERYDMIKKGNSLLRTAAQMPRRALGLPRRLARRILR